jgi:hypothetical protein
MRAETRQRFEQEEQAYWQQREELLKQYEGKWVAIIGGQQALAARPSCANFTTHSSTLQGKTSSSPPTVVTTPAKTSWGAT